MSKRNTPPPRHSRGEDRKTRQLCKQVGEAIQHALSAECDDPKLHQLIVDAVLPEPSARRLRVILYAPFPEPNFNRKETQLRVETLTGFFRAEVGLSITRKRVPDLIFSVLAPEEVERP